MSNIASHANSEKVYRVAQWAAGRIGQSAMRAVIRHPNMEQIGRASCRERV